MPKLHYFTVRPKNWSPSPVFCSTRKEAEVREVRSMEATGNFSDRSTVGHIELKVVDGKIFFKDVDPDYVTHWIELT